MGKKKSGLYTALWWLREHPESTAYEVCRGIDFHDAWRVFEWFLLAEKQGMVAWVHKAGEVTPRWKVTESSRL